MSETKIEVREEVLMSFLYGAMKCDYTEIHHDGYSRAVISDGDKRTCTIRAKNEWEYVHEQYGTPHSGTIKVVFKNEKVLFLRYQSNAMLSEMKENGIYDCLVQALTAQSSTRMWRGPDKHVCPNGLCYKHGWNGKIEKFDGDEYVLNEYDELLYSAHYIGETRLS